MRKVCVAIIFLSTLVSRSSEIWGKTQQDISAWQSAGEERVAESKPTLRVVYFHGNDREPLADYEGRLTRVMEDVSGFFKDGMRLHGMTGEGLPLERNADGSVKIHVVKGLHESAHYDYSSGGETETEIRRALDGKMNFDREFVLILYGQCWKLPDGRWGFYSPYYGKGGSCQKWGFCHAADCELLDPELLRDRERRIQYSEHYGDRDQTVAQFNSFYLGGIAHELGHALGLPHECESPHEKRNLGTSLMGSGNLTYRQELWKPDALGSFLSLSSAVRLASHPLFTGLQRRRFEDVDAGFSNLASTISIDTLNLRGKVSSGIPAYAVIAYVDPEGRSDYDARSYTVPVIDNDFYFEDLSIPKEHFVFRLVACHFNGATSMIAASLQPGEILRKPETLARSLAAYPFKVAELSVAAGRPDAAARVQALKQIAGTTAEQSLEIALLENWLKPAKTQWIDLRTTELESCYLSDADWKSAKAGWAGTPRDRWGADPSMGQGLFLRLGGQLQEKGLPAHCPAAHVFQVAGRWKRFTATAGVRDGAGPLARAIFLVKADGKEIYRSPQLAEGSNAVIDLDITGAAELELVTESGLEHNRTCWAVWGMPLVTR